MIDKHIMKLYKPQMPVNFLMNIRKNQVIIITFVVLQTMDKSILSK